MKRSLKEYIRDREMRQTGGVPESAPFHSRSYRRYFEGWSEYQVVLPDGKKKIERIYTGVYHSLQASRGERIRRKIIYLLLCAGSAALFFLAAIASVPGNTVWYVTAPEALMVAALFYLLIKAAGYAAAPEQMTEYEYRVVAGLKKASRIAGAGLLVLTAAKGIYSILHHGPGTLEELKGAGMFAGAAICSIAVTVLERSSRYTQHMSDAQAPENAHEIHP